jgi:hypothetical protein
MSGVNYAEKDSNVAGRADVNMSVVLYNQLGVEQVTGEIPAGSVPGFYADYTIKVSQPILGLPTFEIKDDEV